MTGPAGANQGANCECAGRSRTTPRVGPQRRVRRLPAICWKHDAGTEPPTRSLSFLGGETSQTRFDEVRRCYVEAVLTWRSYRFLWRMSRENWLRCAMRGAGKQRRRHDVWEQRSREPPRMRVLSELEWRTYQELARLRNSHAHFRMPGSSESMMARMVEENAFPREVLAKDAKRALSVRWRGSCGARPVSEPRWVQTNEWMEGNP